MPKTDKILQKIQKLQRELRKVMPPPCQTHRDKKKIIHRKRKHKGDET
jgi:hypothetical protein